LLEGVDGCRINDGLLLRELRSSVGEKICGMKENYNSGTGLWFLDCVWVEDL